jgi:acyl-CoA thioesterase I
MVGIEETAQMRFNRRFILIGLFALIGLAVFWWRSRAEKWVNDPPTATGPWVAFGDSLTAGEGAAPGEDYPAALGLRLGVAITNLGVRGETTAEALGRLEAAARLHPRVVLLCLGGNDGLQQVPDKQTFANLGSMIDRFVQEGSFVVLIGIHGVSLVDRYDKPFRNLARQKRVLLVPNMLRGVLGQPRLMADYVHPNGEGYQVIAVRLESVLRPLLPRLRP